MVEKTQNMQDTQKEKGVIKYTKIILVIFLLYECLRDLVSIFHSYHNIVSISAEFVESLFHFTAAVFLIPHRLKEMFSHYQRETFVTFFIISIIGLIFNFVVLPWKVALLISLVVVVSFFTIDRWKYSFRIFISMMILYFMYGTWIVYLIFTPLKK